METPKIDPELEAQLVVSLQNPGSPVARAVINLLKAWAYTAPSDDGYLVKLFAGVHRNARTRGYIE